jgi:hypothetical protein
VLLGVNKGHEIKEKRKKRKKKPIIAVAGVGGDWDEETCKM